MSASGKPQWKDLYEPKVPGFIRVPKDDLSAVARAIGPRTAAVMLEPIQGEAGVIPFSASFLRGLRRWQIKRAVFSIWVRFKLESVVLERCSVSNTRQFDLIS